MYGWMDGCKGVYSFLLLLYVCMYVTFYVCMYESGIIFVNMIDMLFLSGPSHSSDSMRLSVSISTCCWSGSVSMVE